MFEPCRSYIYIVFSHNCIHIQLILRQLYFLNACSALEIKASSNGIPKGIVHPISSLINLLPMIKKKKGSADIF